MDMSALYIIAQPTQEDQNGGLPVSPLCCSGNPTTAATARTVNIIISSPAEETFIYSGSIVTSNSTNSGPAFYDIQLAVGQRLQPRSDA